MSTTGSVEAGIGQEQQERFFVLFLNKGQDVKIESCKEAQVCKDYVGQIQCKQ
jgi:hypothetical protein